MKAIRVNTFGGPEQLELETLPDLKAGAGEVVVNIRAVGINPVETYIRTGAHTIKPQLPYTPGGDGAGDVAEVGADVGHVTVGDRVYVGGSLSGTYAQQCLCRADQVHPIPESIDYADGAAVNTPYVTAYWALHHRAAARPGETVLVHGASGGVGLAGVQLAAAHGCNVIGTGGTDAGRQLVIDSGANHVLDHTDPAYLDAIPEITQGRGVDVVLEMLSNVNLAKDLQIMALGGRIAIIGCRGTIEINPRAAMTREVSILGVLMGNTTPEQFAAIHAAIGAGLRNGTLRPHVGRQFSLAEAPKAHEAVMAAGASGKIILTTG